MYCKLCKSYKQSFEMGTKPGGSHFKICSSCRLKSRSKYVCKHDVLKIECQQCNKKRCIHNKIISSCTQCKKLICQHGNIDCKICIQNINRYLEYYNSNVYIDRLKNMNKHCRLVNKPISQPKVNSSNTSIQIVDLSKFNHIDLGPISIFDTTIWFS
jgi:hypothetical protein